VAWPISIIVTSLWFLAVTIPYAILGRIHLLQALAAAVAMIPILLNEQSRGD
jgi:hypothetical protein